MGSDQQWIVCKQSVASCKTWKGSIHVMILVGTLLALMNSWGCVYVTRASCKLKFLDLKELDAFFARLANQFPVRSCMPGQNLYVQQLYVQLWDDICNISILVTWYFYQRMSACLDRFRMVVGIHSIF